MFGIERIDFERVIDHGHVPVKEVNKNTLAVTVHIVTHCADTGRNPPAKYLKHR
jgi:hypothetical protein